MLKTEILVHAGLPYMQKFFELAPKVLLKDRWHRMTIPSVPSVPSISIFHYLSVSFIHFHSISLFFIFLIIFIFHFFSIFSAVQYFSVYFSIFQHSSSFFFLFLKYLLVFFSILIFSVFFIIFQYFGGWKTILEWPKMVSHMREKSAFSQNPLMAGFWNFGFFKFSVTEYFSSLDARSNQMCRPQIDPSHIHPRWSC